MTATQKTDVTDRVNEIKTHMPETYTAIQAKADVIGNVAYELVRRGLRGESNCFYAFERGRVVGTPFNCPAITDAVAGYMVRFGVSACSIWPDDPVHAPAQPGGL